MRSHEQTNPFLFSTTGMTPQQGFEQWQTSLWNLALPYNVFLEDTRHFTARTQAIAAGNLTLITNFTQHDSGVTATHNSAEVSRSGGMLHLFMQDGPQSSHLQYRHSEQTVHQGEWIVLSPDDVHTWYANGNMGKFHFLHLPENICRMVPGSQIGKPMTPDCTLNRLVANYIQTLASCEVAPHGVTGDAIARNLLDLVSLALKPNLTPEDSHDESIRSGLLLAIRQYIDEHFAQPGLSPAQVAAHCGITPRYLHRLFEQTGTTFSEHVYQRRLQHSRRLLTDPLQRDRGILEIALDCGFRDLSHFGRRYRQMFGETPRDTRMQIPPAKRI